jgi:hypothetical protein
MVVNLSCGYSDEEQSAGRFITDITAEISLKFLF